jgi:hypothetical protein
MPHTTAAGDERTGDVAHALIALMAGLIGPPFVSIVYLVAAASIREASGAEGFARASLDENMYFAYVFVLVVFVLIGTWKSRGTLARVLFAITSVVVSLVAMFVAFFSQMAP